MAIAINRIINFLGVLMVFSASAQVIQTPFTTKVDDQNATTTSINSSALSANRDTNTYTLINITGASTSKNKNPKEKRNSNLGQPNDNVKTKVFKAKQTSKHLFDSFVVNIICAGVNAFVKND